MNFILSDHITKSGAMLALQVYLVIFAAVCVTIAVVMLVYAAVELLRLRRGRTTFPAFEGVRIAPVAAQGAFWHWNRATPIPPVDWRVWDERNPDWGNW
jgi:hypothetical protein